MKTLIVALNSSFVHTSLAPWYLRASCGETCGDIRVLELTVNRPYGDILRAVCEENPQVAAFSCYIFNIGLVEHLVRDIRRLLPDTRVVLGGPEVSYDAPDVLRRCGAHYLICGEGERPFAGLLAALAAGNPPPALPGLVSRSGDRISACPPEPPAAPDSLPSPYTDEMLAGAKGRILYFEASRGCPFRCAYCLSSVSGGARFFGIDRVKRDLTRAMRSEAKQIKFVDRTFNCNPAAPEIVRFIRHAAQEDERVRRKNFHFEAAADLFTDELLTLLTGAPAGLFQLEIGIQSFHPATLEAVQRRTDPDKCRTAIRRLLAPGNIHIHLDLIAGLPQEDYASFRDSFDRVYAIGPHCIQLGFLKLLKGSRMRADADAAGYVYGCEAPYEVMRTPWLSYGELCRLHDIAECVDRLYSTGRFTASLRYIAGRTPSMFDFFQAFAGFVRRQGGFDRSLPMRELYSLLLRFVSGSPGFGDPAFLSELLKFDCYASDNSGNLPAGLRHISGADLRSLYAGHAGKSGRLHFETFLFDPVEYEKSGRITEEPATVGFDYDGRDPVTGRFSAAVLPGGDSGAIRRS